MLQRGTVVWNLARRNLFKERTRLLISVGGVAFAVLLMVLLRGLYVSYEQKVGAYFEHIGSDAWIVQEGTADFFHSFSLVPHDLAEPVAALDGVRGVAPYLARQVAFELNGRDALLYVAGYDPNSPITGPIQVVDGTLDIGDDGLVIDEVFASREGVDLGDVLTLNGRDLTVEGISAGGDMVMFQYAFATTPTVRDLVDMPHVNNALLVDLDADTTINDLQTQLPPGTTGLDVRTTGEVVGANEEVITASFLPVISALLGIGFLVGTAVIGLTIYSAVLEKRREYGVLKAIGGRTRQMVTLVSAQAVMSAVLGYVAGIALASLAAGAADRWVPAFTTQIVVTDVAWLALVVVVMAVLASVLPLTRVARIDPAEVFRA